MTKRQEVSGRCAASRRRSAALRAEPATQSQAKPAAANAEDFNTVWDNRPPAPTGDKPITVTVVGRRCIYVNNYRIAGSKPYVSEGLPSHDLKTTLGDVLEAFSPTDIRRALAEKKARIKYFQDYHERRRAASVDTHPQGGDANAAPFMSGAVGEAETPK